MIQPNHFPISWIPIPNGNNIKKLGISYCPGKQPIESTNKSNLQNDLKSISNQEIKCIVSLLTSAELSVLKIKDFKKNIKMQGFQHYTEEIEDLGVPSQIQMNSFKKLIKNIISEIRRDNNVLVHCNAGMGRSGLVAGVILREMTELLEPIEYVRKFRKGAIETQIQEEFIKFWYINNDLT